MSDTPRTDVLLVAWDMSPTPKVLIDHARELERELNAANKRVKQLKDAMELVVPVCQYLHHPKKYQHASGEPCPCEDSVRKALEDKR